MNKINRLTCSWAKPETKIYGRHRQGLGPILGGSGIKLAKGVSVFNDGMQDKLKGNGGLDWSFFLLGEDELQEMTSTEQTN